MNRDAEVIKQLLEFTGLSRKAFSEKIGISSPQWIADLMNPKKNVGLSKNKAALIIAAFPDLNIDWLMTGEGTMLKSSEESVVSAGREKSQSGPMFKEDRAVMVPLINIDSVGGIHSQNALVASEQYVEGVVPFVNAKPGDVAIMQSGDSMSPTIPPSSILHIRRVEDWQEYFGYGNVFVLLLRDGRRITKQVKRYDEDPRNYVMCCSYNPDAADEELPKSMIVEVWKVIHVLTDKGW